MSGPVDFRVVEAQRADDLFSAPLHEAKWAVITTALLQGESVFVAGMTRIALETLRAIIKKRHYGRLHSRQMLVDGEAGKLLRLRKPKT